ncbi:MAG TPA: adenosine deaminase [Terriglobales bacterium]|nr:adenosine deaminase [Terriglobales bacterium]
MPPDFIQSLPKAELHLHLEGTVEPATLAELSRRHVAAPPFPGNRYQQPPEGLRELSQAGVRELYQYQDFQGFLMAFKAVTERMRAPEDYELVTYKLMERLRTENVRHAEVYVSVGVVHWRGQEFAPLFAGMERGRRRGEKDFGVSLLWLFDAVRNFGVEAAERVLDETIALHQQHDSVVGFGIGGDERRGPAEFFADAYRRAREHGLRLTAHAGENAGPESIWAALNIGAERIGHGLNAAADADLMSELAERQVPIEVCVSSNLRTQCCPSINLHPLRNFFERGLMVTLNSDDPAMFSSSLSDEYRLAQQHFEFSDDQLRELARNSFEASFLPPEKKLKFLNEVDAYPINDLSS